jgi:hypothetical protein
MKPLLRTLCIAVAAAAIAPVVVAHHASNLDYDADKVGTIEGVVDDIFWANPHIHFYLTVTAEDGTTQIWDMEGPNLNSLRRRGVARDMVAVGDTITVSGTLGRDGTRRIWAESIIKLDGTLVMGAAP